jgi:hypothetical protein
MAVDGLPAGVRTGSWSAGLLKYNERGRRDTSSKSIDKEAVYKYLVVTVNRGAYFAKLRCCRYRGAPRFRISLP